MKSIGRHQIWVVLGISCLLSVLSCESYGASLTIGDTVSVNGDMNATSFSGDGSGLTNVGGNSWHQTLPSGERFLPVMGDTAVLDRETGLVWERSPSNTGGRTYVSNWIWAQQYCLDLKKGNRMGWRAPTINELASLSDLSLPSGLPAGVFNNVRTSEAYVSTTGRVTFYFDGSRTEESEYGNVWCVRGGPNPPLLSPTVYWQYW